MLHKSQIETAILSLGYFLNGCMPYTECYLISEIWPGVELPSCAALLKWGQSAAGQGPVSSTVKNNSEYYIKEPNGTEPSAGFSSVSQRPSSKCRARAGINCARLIFFHCFRCSVIRWQLVKSHQFQVYSIHKNKSQFEVNTIKFSCLN